MPPTTFPPIDVNTDPRSSNKSNLSMVIYVLSSYTNILEEIGVALENETSIRRIEPLIQELGMTYVIEE